MLIIHDLRSQRRTWRSTRARGPSHAPPGPWRADPGLVVRKFGEQLRSSVIREYQWSYIDYDGLKNDLKHPSGPALRRPGESPSTPGRAGGDAADAGSRPRGRRGSKPKRPLREWTEEDE